MQKRKLSALSVFFPIGVGRSLLNFTDTSTKGEAVVGGGAGGTALRKVGRSLGQDAVRDWSCKCVVGYTLHVKLLEAGDDGRTATAAERVHGLRLYLQEPMNVVC